MIAASGLALDPASQSHLGHAIVVVHHATPCFFHSGDNGRRHIVGGQQRGLELDGHPMAVRIPIAGQGQNLGGLHARPDDRTVEFKCTFWERALEEVGDSIDVVVEADDLGSQNSMLLSPRTYRKLIQPRHDRLFWFIKDQAPVKVFLHSCGAVRPNIPDLIDTGIDILNPVQISASGMDPYELKQEFGRDLVFWGGGVDTQQVLSFGTPQEVQDDVRRNVEALAPGGGFVSATVHDIQANVPPENIMAMWDAWHSLKDY